MKKTMFFAIAGLCLLAACKYGADKKLSTDEAIKKAGAAPGVNAGSGNFEIDAPAGWMRMDTSLSGLKATLLFAPDATNGFRSNVNVVTQAMSGMTADAYFDASLDFMSKNMNQFKAVDKGTKDVNGTNVRWVHYNDQQNGMPLDQLLYVVPSGGIAYMITCTCLQGDYTKSQAGFDQAVSSFKIK